MWVSVFGCSAAETIDYGNLNKTGTQWSPYLEWSIERRSYSGNPYEVVADVTFVQAQSGVKHTTQMFYDGGAVWKFRFTGTVAGEWVFKTSSNQRDLNGLKGTVIIEPNSDPNARGFVTNCREKWMWMANEQVFVPQFVMYRTPKYFFNQPDKIDADIQTWFIEHGFNGLHVMVFHAWFDLEVSEGAGKLGSYKELGTRNPDPDRRTFEALEMLITKVHKAGGVVHIWMWGDEGRRQTPRGLTGGINGPVDQRLQRYIAARLGPIPGWTMGYGYDNWEWNDREKQEAWHAYMHQHLGWPHMLGVRWEKNQLTQATEALDYSSYEQHKPDYDKYVETILARPHKPSFSEDRFRVRGADSQPKDYSLDETRRGLWHSIMAGGVANIWGNQIRLDGNVAWDEAGSNPYPNKHQIKTCFRFFSGRFLKDMERANHLTDGYGLKNSSLTNFVFYKEDATALLIDLSGIKGSMYAIAVDTKKSYEEINLGRIDAVKQTWTAPYISDWAIAVRSFASPEVDTSTEFN